MQEAVRTPVQSRDEAVRQPEAPITRPWAPRTDGKNALLVSERTTVFDRPAVVPVVAVDPIEEIAAGDAPSLQWTADLVHCRLLNVGDTIARLPSPLRKRYVSVLSDEGRTPKRPPSPAEISIADWTWSQLLKRPTTQRSILQAMAFGASGEDVAKMLSRGGMRVHRATVIRWYMSERKQLAMLWVMERQLVDQGTHERWRGLFERHRK